MRSPRFSVQSIYGGYGGCGVTGFLPMEFPEISRSKAFAKARVQLLSAGLPFARIEGVDLREVEAADGEVLQSLISEHGVLCFPQQNLTPEQELNVNRAFGYHDTAEETVGGPSQKYFGFASSVDSGVPVHAVPGCPLVQVQGNGTFKDHCGIEEVTLQVAVGFLTEGFHSDGLHDQADFDSDTLPVLTSMYCHQACTDGTGETNFLCSRAPLRKLSSEQLAFLRGCRLHYQSRDVLKQGRPVMEGGLRRLRRPGQEEVTTPVSRELLLASAEAGPVHPIIRRHADTGDEALCISCGNVAFMVSPKGVEGPAACYDLIESFFADQEMYAHRWHPGDFVIWDNRLCLHAGPRAVHGDRLMHRVRLRGSARCNADCAEVWKQVRQERAEGLW
ncbi:xanA [Symbiodinium natans]|uniref:XanA protein n=1 Tax=Symbiodinium natans TaxID=878477 RepID=A0A812U499_9DINO|nr:xanA [Symbiodinium natans]